MSVLGVNLSQFSILAPDRRHRGICAPFVDDGRGPFEAKDTGHTIWSSIVNILLTPKGSRIWLLNFGSNLPSLLFEPNTSQLEALARIAVFDAIGQWEPRVKVLSTKTYRDDGSDFIHLTMTYEIIKDGKTETRSLSFDSSAIGAFA